MPACLQFSYSEDSCKEHVPYVLAADGCHCTAKLLPASRASASVAVLHWERRRRRARGWGRRPGGGVGARGAEGRVAWRGGAALRRRCAIAVPCHVHSRRSTQSARQRTRTPSHSRAHTEEAARSRLLDLERMAVDESSPMDGETTTWEMTTSAADTDAEPASAPAFGAADYAVFALTLLATAAVGVFFSWRARRRWLRGSGGGGSVLAEKERAREAAEEELLGGRRLGVVPVALSLVASYVSGVTLLGSTAEVYVFGVDFALAVLGLALAAAVHAAVFLPTLHQLRLTSAYEYLEMRFDRRVRMLGSLLFVVGNLAWIPIVLYLPALALNQVTGVPVFIITPVVSVICILYTSVGGLRAVVWADVAQTVAMVAGVLLVAAKGTIDAGGFGAVWSRARQGGRLDPPQWGADPSGVWALLLGGGAYWLHENAGNQNQAQRYLALPTLRSARIAVALFAVGAGAIILLCWYCGLLLYALFHDCDPIFSGVVQRPDQLLPLLVARTVGAWPGLTGLFVAAIFSAVLSSMSTALNSLAAVALEDFYRPLWAAADGRRASAARARLVVRGAVVAAGVAIATLALVVEHLGTVKQMAISLAALSYGPLLGLFVAGLLAPCIDERGALAGGAAALAATAWVVLGAQATAAAGNLPFPIKNASLAGCPAALLPATPPLLPPGYFFPLYRLSFMWNTLLGSSVCVGVALAVSFALRLLTPRGEHRPPVDPQLLSPVVRPRPRAAAAPADSAKTNGVHNGLRNLQYQAVELRDVPASA